MLRFYTLRLISGLIGALTLALGAGNAFGAEAYYLGVSDHIAVKVVEWLPGQATFKSWDAISGEYIIGPTGSVSVPFLGEATAAGRTTAELAHDFSSQLTQTFGLTTPPDVTIEILSFGPVYVAGDVTNSGAYPFSPGLNVIKATSLAGGGKNLADSEFGNTRDIISTRGSYLVTQGKLQRLLVTRARLDAELGKLANIAVPPELASIDVADLNPIISAEQAVLSANASKADGQKKSLSEYANLLDQQLRTLEQKKTSVEQQLALARDEQTTVQLLADKGLAANSRVSDILQSVADLETRLLDINNATLQAQRDINDNARSLLSLDGDHIADLTVQRQQVDGQIAELQVQISTQQSLMSNFLVDGDRDAVDTISYQYSIIRGDEEIAATDTTAVRPGDVVKVKRVSAQPDANP